MGFRIALGKHLRGKVRNRSEERLRVISLLGQSEISQSKVPIAINEDVRGFEISIQKAILMYFLKSQGGLTGIILSNLLIQLLLPYKALQVAVFAELKEYVKMREILKAGVRLNDERMFHCD